jgi:hypothetical protein
MLRVTRERTCTANGAGHFRQEPTSALAFAKDGRWSRRQLRSKAMLRLIVRCVT